MVAFTVERFIAVRYPLKRQTMCTVKRARLMLFALILIGSIVCIPYLLYSAPVDSEDGTYKICDIREEYKVSVSVSFLKKLSNLLIRSRSKRSFRCKLLKKKIYSEHSCDDQRTVQKNLFRNTALKLQKSACAFSMPSLVA